MAEMVTEAAAETLGLVEEVMAGLAVGTVEEVMDSQ